MPRLFLTNLSLMAGLMVAAGTLAAHHGSNISYHLDQTIVLQGVLTEWDFINPHPQIYFDVTDGKGAVAHWVAEVLPTPLMMKNYNVGWTRKTMVPGDKIVLACNPPRAEGAKACLAKQLMVNGKSFPIAPGPVTPITIPAQGAK
jgi:hypothetical protein